MKQITLILILIIFCLSLQAQDSGIKDTVKFIGDTIYIGQSTPIGFAIVNDHAIALMYLGFQIINYTPGKVQFDSVVFINRMDDPSVFDLRIARSEGYPDSLFIAGQRITGNLLPSGSDAIVKLFFTGITPGEIVIDSTHRPPSNTFGFIESKDEGGIIKDHYEPEFSSKTFQIIERVMPPTLSFPDDTRQIITGENIQFDITAVSNTGATVNVNLKNISKYDMIDTPTNDPIVTNNSFYWMTASGDVGIWEITLEACDDDENCTEKSFIVQIVEDQNYLTKFSLHSNSGIPMPFEMEIGDINNDNYNELIFIDYPHIDGKSLTVLEYDYNNHTYSEKFNIQEYFNKRGLNLGYLDNDDYLDIIFTNRDPMNNRVQVFINNGNNGFDFINETPAYFIHRSTLNDFNNDQYLDYFSLRYDAIQCFYGNNFHTGHNLVSNWLNLRRNYFLGFFST